MDRAALVADFRHLRCGRCKVALHDELARCCPVCQAVFDSITSNHAGLAARLRRRREEAGLPLAGDEAAGADVDPVELIGS